MNRKLTIPILLELLLAVCGSANAQVTKTPTPEQIVAMREARAKMSNPIKDSITPLGEKIRIWDPGEKGGPGDGWDDTWVWIHWKSRHPGQVFDPAAYHGTDDDKDGIIAFDEMLFNLSPNEANKLPHLLSPEKKEADRLRGLARQAEYKKALEAEWAARAAVVGNDPNHTVTLQELADQDAANLAAAQAAAVEREQAQADGLFGPPGFFQLINLSVSQDQAHGFDADQMWNARSDSWRGRPPVESK